MGETLLQSRRKIPPYTDKRQRKRNHKQRIQKIRNNLYHASRNRMRRTRTRNSNATRHRRRKWNNPHTWMQRTCKRNIQTENSNSNNAQSLLSKQSTRTPLPSLTSHAPNMDRHQTSSSQKTMQTRTGQNSMQKPTQLFRSTTLPQLTCKRPNRSNETPTTQKTRNNNALHQSNRPRHRRRIHMPTSNHKTRNSRLNRKWIPICPNSRRNTLLPKTQIKTNPLLSYSKTKRDRKNPAGRSRMRTRELINTFP